MARATTRDTVLFVSSWPHLGGAQVSLASVLTALPRSTRRVLAAPDHGVMIDRLHELDVPPEHLVIPDRNVAGQLRTRVSAPWLLAKWWFRNRGRLRAVHANGDGELKLILPLVGFLRVPVVVWYHSREMSASTVKLGPLWRALARRVVWAPVSEVTYERLAEARVATERNMTIVPNPVDASEIVGATSEVRPHTPLRVGYLGCENVSKGILLLPAIARALAARDVELVCVTKEWPADRNSPEVNAALEQLRALDRVTFRKRDFDVRNIYRDVDVLLIPSLSESFCRIAAEAMLNELPVVASDLPAIREVCAGNALLFAPGDTAAAADAIEQLLDNATVYERLARAGPEQVRGLSPEHVCALLDGLYSTSLPVDLRARRIG
jgi:glycosyltransferase involved in cell wall biosynthesis